MLHVENIFDWEGTCNFLGPKKITEAVKTRIGSKFCKKPNIRIFNIFF